MNESQYIEYQKSSSRFLASEQVKQFSTELGADIVVAMVVRELQSEV